MQRLTSLVQTIAGRLLSDVSCDELNCLILPTRHPPLLARKRAEMIISRVRLVAALFAVLTPLWIIVDLTVFALPIALLLAAGRLVTSLAFGVLAMSFGKSGRMADAYRALAIMFAIPTLFFIYSHPLLSHFHMQGAAEAIASGYAFLPFVMLAGLSVFPLTALEGAAFASPVLLAEAVVALLQLDLLNWSSHLGAFWLLVLIAVVSSLAGMSQLGFMIALVGQASHDALTGCFRRASGEELLDIQFRVSSRSGMSLALVFVDLDDFKSVNDQFGHEMGDRMLGMAAKAMQEHLRGGDILIRWGGEEFVIILPNSDCTAAVNAVNRWRTLGLGQRPDGTPLTASYGISERLADCAKDWKHLVQIADQRMLDAKQAGKDQFISCVELYAG
jgi:diguanylate cyclase (GGDEF)-like protein